MYLFYYEMNVKRHDAHFKALFKMQTFFLQSISLHKPRLLLARYLNPTRTPHTTKGNWRVQSLLEQEICFS